MASSIVSAITKNALHQKIHRGHPLQYDPIKKAIGDAQIVMIGCQSFGAQEFHEHRTELTKHLISDKQFNVVALGADWPDVRNLHRYVQGITHSEHEAISHFNKFPWWANRNLANVYFLRWLHDHNADIKHTIEKIKLRQTEKVGMYGLDLYGVHQSVHDISRYLQHLDPKAAKKIREQYSFFIDKRSVTDDERELRGILGKKVYEDVVKALETLQNEKEKIFRKQVGFPQKVAHSKGIALDKDDDFWNMEMETKLVIDAEKFFSTVYTEGSTSSWNVRTEHMANTVDEIIKHVSTSKRQAKVVIWQHNTHVGDSAATEMEKRGEQSLSRILKDRYGKKNVFTIGMTTSHGTIYCSPYFDKLPDIHTLPLAKTNSWESILREVGIPSFALLFRSNNEEIKIDKEMKEMLSEEKLVRTIGAIYDLKEDDLHYMESRIAKQFDCLMHIDRTTSVVPFDVLPTTATVSMADTPKYAPFDM